MANQQEIAQWLGISDRQVRNLEKSNVLPGKRGRAGYNEKECVLAYIRYLQANQRKGKATIKEGDDYDPGNPEESGGISLASEEHRYNKLRNDKLELQINELSRKLAPVEILQEYSAKLAAAVGKILDGVPGQIKRRNPKLTTTDLNAIKTEVSKAMNAASRINIELDHYQGLSEGD